MKKLKTLLLLMIATSSFINGQNLVPNAGFETYDTCPSSTGQLSYTGNWVFCGASTDYYNACSPPGSMSVPSNIYGYQNAADGNAYIGMIAYAYGEGQPYSIREPAGTFLSSALTIGVKYFLSFKVIMTLNDFESGGACDKMGAKLSTIAYSASNPAPVDNIANVYTDSIISDTLNWFNVCGSFIADSNYTFISIGNFFDSSNSHYFHYNSLDSFYLYSAYYFIDDIRLSTDSSFVYNSINESNKSSEFSIFPNPNNGIFQIVLPNTSDRKYFVLNSLGRLLYSNETNDSVVRFDLNFLEAGIYYLVITRNNSKYFEKIIINK